LPWENRRVSEAISQPTPPPALLEMLSNMARFHREHEKFYAQAPLRQAVEIQASSRALKALAARWDETEPTQHQVPNPMAGAEDLNAPGLTSESGILFMEGEGEPAEIQKLKRDLESLAEAMAQTGEWLANAMEQAWQTARALTAFPALADLLGERHRIIANDWQSAAMQSLIARLVRRALDLLEHIDFSPPALRKDLAGERVAPGYLYSAAELLDRAADMTAQSTVLVHENDRRWRTWIERVRQLQSAG
jgi:hypothetical protein